ncbi:MULTISPECIES: hypothetical protein [Mycobacterium]|uniref:Uncharacterized protein n=3 Tax=Mycobacterium TaxID=1763 RepID=A0A1X1YMI1_9MYCO|nr:MULTISPECIES: hypothetical protein [Mycobacterium]ORW12233.1 hypothetical protein AWC14_01205 [Mycobacterium kyorinense]
MAQTSSWFAAFVRETRERSGRSQQEVHDAGGPYRQAQAAIESEQGDHIPDYFLPMFDHAYGWPRGYTQALAELGEYIENPELGDALRGDERDAAVLADYDGQPPPTVWKTFGGLYEDPNQATGYSPAYLGFDPTTGEPVCLEGPLLTNVPFEHLHPMILARHGTTTIDVNVVDANSMNTLTSHYAGGYVPESAAQQPIKLYRTGTSDPAQAEPIAIDSLSEITLLSEAKNLAAALRKIRPHVPTTTIRAAFTFLAIVAFGEDPILTMTELLRRGTDTAATEFNTRFEQFWQEFYDPAKAGPELARPDHHACDLLAGVLAARDEVLTIDIGNHKGQRHPRYDIPRTVRPDSILPPSAPPAMLFYDSNIAPEMPVALSHQWITASLSFYAAELKPGGGVWPPLGPRIPYQSVGITSADDRDIVAQRDSPQYKPDGLSTLTNYCGGQAIYCESRGTARRVWLPHR